ncbi:MAG: radical SAM protein [candidate division WOR-3 bacterium]
MKYRQSFYNILYEDAKMKGALLYNTFTGALIRIDDSNYQNIRDLLSDPNNIKLRNAEIDKFQKMLELGFIVEEETDELSLVRLRHFNGVFKSEEYFALTIILTFSCNFKCIYCYETPQNKHLNEIDLQEIIRYTKTKLQNNKYKKMYIGWYGGEPLLCSELLIKLSQTLRQLCSDNGLSYYSALITNGYLLTYELGQILKESGVDEIQITLDGPELIHNKRRILKNGNPTFEEIKRAILVAADIFNKVKVRINVDRDNLTSIDNLLKERWLYRDNIQLGVGHLKDYSDVCSLWNPSNLALTGEEYYALVKKVEQSTPRKKLPDLKTLISIPVKSRVCGADHKDGFCIGPGARVYKCLSALDIHEAVGYLKSGKFWPNKRYANWLMNDPTEQTECCRCNILPLCMGGCPYYRQNRAESINRSICTFWRAFLHSHLGQIASCLAERR